VGWGLACARVVSSAGEGSRRGKDAQQGERAAEADRRLERAEPHEEAAREAREEEAEISKRSGVRVQRPSEDVSTYVKTNQAIR
jgi:hypothetical protein